MTENTNRPHKWQPSRLGHGESMCVYCYGTNREIAVIGDMNHCPKAPANDAAPTKASFRGNGM